MKLLKQPDPKVVKRVPILRILTSTSDSMTKIQMETAKRTLEENSKFNLEQMAQVR
jgi:hypothetical protein